MGGKWDPLQDPPSWSLSWNDLKYTQGPSYWQFPSPPWKAWHIPVLGASSLHPSVYSSSLYRHLCLRLCLPAFWFLIFLGTFSSTLSLSHHSLFSWLISFFCLWPCSLTSCRKAINLGCSAAGSRQSLG